MTRRSLSGHFRPPLAKARFRIEDLTFQCRPPALARRVLYRPHEGGDGAKRGATTRKPWGKGSSSLRVEQLCSA